ncbi:helix-turn-helix domain-containing protein [Spirillospora sp. NPDC048819]|uniref:helix-turn-helix transcriptional regulator n=1 Tax=Spirillospora sp. NPDC048819 TaxID=3155268 RepID=UPI0033DE466B
MDARARTRTDPGAAAPELGESRSQVLAALTDAGASLTVGDVAERVRLHRNTARFHLDALVEAGLAERSTEERDQPGRPRILYTARPEAAHTGRRSYRLLAEILTSFMAAEIPQPGQAALRIGRAWGRYLAERPPPFRRLDAAAATGQLVRALDDIGFAPEAVTAGDERQVLLHHCPFREAAEEHREVVCSIHLGLMQGLLEELDAPVAAERLDPFVEPSLCVTHLAAANGATSA